MGKWINDDGLLVRFGTDKAEVAAGGSYASNAGHLVTDMIVEFGDVGASASPLDYNLSFGKDSRIEKIEIIVETAFAGAGFALDVGLQRKDYATELDYDGLLAAIALTSLDAAGETTEITVGSTGAGALVGTTLANAGVVTVNHTGTAPTAGKAIVRVYSRTV